MHTAVLRFFLLVENAYTVMNLMPLKTAKWPRGLANGLIAQRNCGVFKNSSPPCTRIATKLPKRGDYRQHTVGKQATRGQEL